MYICDFSRSVGAGSATTRNTRGLTREVMRLIVPPLPAVSRPSNTMQIFAPVALTHSCIATSSPWSTRSSASYGPCASSSSASNPSRCAPSRLVTATNVPQPSSQSLRFTSRAPGPVHPGDLQLHLLPMARPVPSRLWPRSMITRGALVRPYGPEQVISSITTRRVEPTETSSTLSSLHGSTST